MRTSHAVGHAVTASAALVMLAGCSGGSSQVAPTVLAQVGAANQAIRQQAFQTGRLNRFTAIREGIVPGHRATTPSFMDRGAVNKPLIFVVDYFNNVVDIFLQGKSHKAVGQITGLTALGGAATDAAGNLYLTSASSVLVYAPPYTGTATILQDAGNAAFDVAVSRAGVVGIANVCTLPSCALNTGSVTFYAANSTVPCATVAVKANVNTAAFDEEGNLFFVGIVYPPVGQGSPVIGEVKGGCNAKKSALLTTNNNINEGDARIDRADRIAILGNNPSGASTIFTYNHPKNGSLGNPVSTTPLRVPNSSFLNDFKFVASGSDLYTSEQVPSGSRGPAFSSEYEYRGGGAPESTIQVTANGATSAVALTPPLVP